MTTMGPRQSWSSDDWGVLFIKFSIFRSLVPRVAVRVEQRSPLSSRPPKSLIVDILLLVDLFEFDPLPADKTRFGQQRAQHSSLDTSDAAGRQRTPN